MSGWNKPNKTLSSNGKARTVHTMELYPLNLSTGGGAPFQTAPLRIAQGIATTRARAAGAGAEPSRAGAATHSSSTAADPAAYPVDASAQCTCGASPSPSSTSGQYPDCPRDGQRTGQRAAADDRAQTLLAAQLRQMLLERMQAKQRERFRTAAAAPSPAHGAYHQTSSPFGQSDFSSPRQQTQGRMAAPPPSVGAHSQQARDVEVYLQFLEAQEAAAKPTYDPMNGRRHVGSNVAFAGAAGGAPTTIPPTTFSIIPDFTAALHVSGLEIGVGQSLAQRRLKDSQTSVTPDERGAGADDEAASRSEEPELSTYSRGLSASGIDGMYVDSRQLVKPQKSRRRGWRSAASADATLGGSASSAPAPSEEENRAFVDPFRVHQLEGVRNHDRTIMAWVMPREYTTPSGNMVVGVGPGGKRARPGAWQSLQHGAAGKHHHDPSAGAGDGGYPRYGLDDDGKLTVRLDDKETAPNDAAAAEKPSEHDLTSAVNEAIEKGYGKELDEEERREAEKLLQEKRAEGKKSTSGKKGGKGPPGTTASDTMASGTSGKGKKKKKGGKSGKKVGDASAGGAGGSDGAHSDLDDAIGYPIGQEKDDMAVGGAAAAGAGHLNDHPPSPSNGTGDAVPPLDPRQSFDHTLTNDELDSIRRKYAEAGGDGSPLYVGDGSPEGSGLQQSPSSATGPDSAAGGNISGTLPTMDSGGSPPAGGSQAGLESEDAASGTGGTHHPPPPLQRPPKGGEAVEVGKSSDEFNGVFNTDWEDFANSIEGKMQEAAAKGGDWSARPSQSLSAAEQARREQEMLLQKQQGASASEAMKKELEDDEKRLDELIKNFPDAAKHVRLRKEANALLGDLGLDDDDDAFAWMRLPVFEQFGSPRNKSGKTGVDVVIGPDGAVSEEEALAGFTANEEALRKKYRAEAEEDLKDLVARRNALREDVSKQLELLHSFKNDVRFLSSGSTEMKMSGEQYAVYLTREVGRFATEYNLTLSDAFAGSAPDKDATSLETVAEGFLNRFSHSRAATRDVGSQVDDRELGYVDDGVQEAEAQMEDFFMHEKGLVNSIKLGAVAMANLMSFHSSLELESTCKECFYLFEQPRTLWPCGHTFCQSCLTGMYNAHDELICSECGSLCEVGYTPNLSVELIANYQIVQSDGSGGNTTAPRGDTIEGVLRALLSDLMTAQKDYSSSSTAPAQNSSKPSSKIAPHRAKAASKAS